MGSCSEFIDCREGQPFMQSCGHGAVFDEIFGCVHPDETNRVGCTASEVLGFKCPPSTGERKFDEETYPPEEVDKDVQAAVREKIEKEIRAELEAKFGLSSGSLSGPLSSVDLPASSRDEPPARGRAAAKPAPRGRPRFSPPSAQEKEAVQPIDLPVEDAREEQTTTTTTERPRRRPPIFNF